MPSDAATWTLRPSGKTKHAVSVQAASNLHSLAFYEYHAVLTSLFCLALLVLVIMGGFVFLMLNDRFLAGQCLPGVGIASHIWSEHQRHSRCY